MINVIRWLLMFLSIPISGIVSAFFLIVLGFWNIQMDKDETPFPWAMWGILFAVSMVMCVALINSLLIKLYGRTPENKSFVTNFVKTFGISALIFVATWFIVMLIIESATGSAKNDQIGFIIAAIVSGSFFIYYAFIRTVSQKELPPMKFPDDIKR